MRAFLRELLERGLRIELRLLVVIDGAKTTTNAFEAINAGVASRYGLHSAAPVSDRNQAVQGSETASHYQGW